MRLLFFAPLLAAIPAAAFADPLTFDEALARAADEAPSLQARALAVDARRSAATAAGQLPDPRLGVALDNFPVSGPPAFTYAGESMTMARVGISQDVPNLAKRHARTGRAEADIDVAEADRVVEAREIRVATALAWIDLAYAGQRLTAINDVLGRLSELAPAAVAGMASGTSRPAQALEIRQAIADLKDRRSQVVADVARATTVLAHWTGDPHPETEGMIPDFAVDPDRLRGAIEHNPTLLAAIARTSQAEAGVTVARAEKRPDWSFDLSYGRRAERYGDMVSIGATVTLPLFTSKRQNPMIDASIADAGAARADEENVRRGLMADLDAGIADHLMHHEQWQRARDTLLPLARQRADLEIASYAAGRASLTDMIAAQAMLADASLSTLDREAAVARDAARLVLTYGDDR
ncbi:MAG: TolC family protein [Altererythrobacter sp.]|nr:TolC family protein [Altererythrobacter sp.]OJU60508.1 MAG: transporter [Altererythrobacter sp. 66-12]